MENLQEKEYLTTSEAATYTQRSIDSIRRWMRETPTIRKIWKSTFPKGWLLKREDLDLKVVSLVKVGE